MNAKKSNSHKIFKQKRGQKFAPARKYYHFDNARLHPEQKGQKKRPQSVMNRFFYTFFIKSVSDYAKRVPVDKITYRPRA